MDYKFQKLTPEQDIELGVYEEAIEYAFDQPDVRNIAISGAYGAGKSSVIKTYEEKHKEDTGNIKSRKFMYISLAHFHETESGNNRIEKITIENNENNICPCDNKIESNVENKNADIRLEGKILNQLIHQIDESKIPWTDFKVKGKENGSRVWSYTWWISGFLILLHFILYNAKWIEVITSVVEKNFYTENIDGNTMLLFGCVAFGVIVITGIYTFVKLQTQRKILKKFSIKGNEIEILGDCQDSYFDRYLNEVLYLFANVDADAIVFEDIDRYGSNQIFVKLREINTLLAKKEKNLKFFYLLRDDIFETTDRTKFFDFIIPVIPVIDGSNAYNKFIQYVNSAGLSGIFEDDFLEGLSLFIDDMRLLKNILNEFQIYYGKFRKTGLDENKLLAMIAYKNLFPRDFGELQVRQGYVYGLFAQKDELRKSAVAKLKKEIEDLSSKIKEIDDEFCNDLKELEALYFMPDVKLRVNKKESSQFLNKIDFVDAIKKNQDNVEYYDQHGYPSWKKYNPKELFDIYQDTMEYQNRKNIIEQRMQGDKEKYQQKILEIEREINHIESEVLRNLITNKNAENVYDVKYVNPLGEKKIFEEVKRSPYYELIQYLISRGYIDETYPDYMTYFYENSISSDDKKFLRAVLGRKSLGFNYKLKNPELVISKLKEHYFACFETLNFDILDCLLRFPNKYETKLKQCIMQLCQFNEEDFIKSYLLRGKYTREFTYKMNEFTDRMSEHILNEETFESIKVCYMTDTLCTASKDNILSINKNNIFRDFVENNIAMNEFEEADVPKVLQSMENLNVKIKKIDMMKVNSLLISNVYKGKMYQLNKKNVNSMLETFYKYEPEEIDWGMNLTQIFRDNNQPLKIYVEENIDSYIKIVLSESEEINDNEEIALFVLNNEQISNEEKKEYILKYRGKIQFLKNVKDNILWCNLLEANIVEDDIENVYTYYFNMNKQLDEHIIKYINESKKELILDNQIIDSVYGENEASNLLNSLILCSEIEDCKFEEILRICDFVYDDFSFEGVSDNKLDILIDKSIIQMTEKNIQNIRKRYPNSIKHFIQHNSSSYIELVEKNKTFKIEEFISLLEVYPSQSKEIKQRIVDISINHIGELIRETKQINVQFLKAFIEQPEVSKKDCIHILIKQLDYLTKVQIKECLRLAKLNEFISLIDGDRPSVEATEDNVLFLNLLIEKFIIESYINDRQKEGYYKVFGKTKYSNGKQRVHELAKELDLSSEDILYMLKTAGRELINHMEVLDEKDYGIIYEALKKIN